MELELSGVTMPPGNPCHREDCSNDSCTSVWQGRIQVNLCGWHLKKLTDGTTMIDREGKTVVDALTDQI